MTKNYYTPVDIIERARKTLLTIDLDPASCEFANKIVKATKYFSAEDSGLDKDWSGNIWCNPPYSRDEVKAFYNKLVEQRKNINSFIMLINTSSVENANRLELLETSDVIVIPKKRISFYDEVGKKTTNYMGNMILGGGDAQFIARFVENFSDLGRVWR